MWRTLSVHSSFSWNVFIQLSSVFVTEGKRSSFMEMQTWDKLLWIVFHFCCRCWICQLWHLVSLLSTFPRSHSHNCLCVSFSLTEGETRSPGMKKDQRNEQKSVMLSQVCGRCSGGFGQQWVAFKGRLSYLTPPLLIWVTLARDGRSEETAATRRCKVTSLIFLNVSEKCSYRGCSNTLFYRSNGFLTIPWN